MVGNTIVGQITTLPRINFEMKGRNRPNSNETKYNICVSGSESACRLASICINTPKPRCKVGEIFISGRSSVVAVRVYEARSMIFHP